MMGCLVDRFLAWVERRYPHPLRVVTHDTGELLFRRYCPFWEDEYVCADGRRIDRPPWWRPFNILLHRWVAGHQESFHDHPRWSITICLRGRIVECTPWRRRELQPGSIVIRSRKAIHAFELPDQRGDVWTIFIVGRRNHSQNGYVVTPFGAKA